MELKRKVAKRSTTSPGSFTVPRDHAIEFLDLGKVVFLFHLIEIHSHVNSLCVSVARGQ